MSRGACPLPARPQHPRANGPVPGHGSCAALRWPVRGPHGSEAIDVGIGNQAPIRVACIRDAGPLPEVQPVFRAAVQVGGRDPGADRAVADAVVPAPGQSAAALVLEGGGGIVHPRAAAAGDRARCGGGRALRGVPAGGPARGDRRRRTGGCSTSGCRAAASPCYSARAWNCTATRRARRRRRTWSPICACH